MVAMFRHFVTPAVRIPVFVLIIATLVTAVDMVMNAWVHDLHKVLGLFIPLIVTNCAILGRAESFAYKNRLLPSMYDGLMMGLGFTLALVILGAIREIVGSGTLFANAHLMLGQHFAFLEQRIIPDYNGFLLAALPPGGFLVLGFLLAGKRILDQRLKDRAEEKALQLAAAET
jgi:electron transport complex protein RnfE